MNLWQRLKAAWNYEKFVPYEPKADDPNFWTQEDAVWLAGVLDSQRGRKLKARLNNHAMRTAYQAVRDPTTTAHRSGTAAGCFMIIRVIETSATILPEQPTTEMLPQEQYAPG